MRSNFRPSCNSIQPYRIALVLVSTFGALSLAIMAATARPLALAEHNSAGSDTKFGADSQAVGNWGAQYRSHLLAKNDADEPTFGSRPFKRPLNQPYDSDNGPPNPGGKFRQGRNDEEVPNQGFGRVRPFVGERRPFSDEGGPPGSSGAPRMWRHRFGSGSGGFFGHHPLDFSRLNLTDEQRVRIQEIRGQNSSKAKELKKRVADSRNQMRDVLFDPNASDEQIRAKRKELRRLQDQIEDTQINDFLAIRKVLTAEQRQKLAELKPDPESERRRIGDRTWRFERPEGPPDRSWRGERQERVEREIRSDRSDRRIDRAERPDSTDRPQQPEHPE